MKAIPNILSFSRIALSIALVFMKPLSSEFYLLYIICGMSDMADGFIARRAGATSKFGEKLDSAADLVMAIVLMIIFYPIINPSAVMIVWIALIGIVRLASAAVAYKKFRAFAILHTYGNKITGLALFLFPLFIPYFSMDILIYTVCTVASISAVEELMIQLASKQLDRNKQSMFIK